MDLTKMTWAQIDAHRMKCEAHLLSKSKTYRELLEINAFEKVLLAKANADAKKKDRIGLAEGEIRKEKVSGTIPVMGHTVRYELKTSYYKPKPEEWRRSFHKKFII